MSDNNSKYDPEYCRDLIEHMSTGCSYATFGAKIGVTYRTMKRWEGRHPEWAEAVELGTLTCMYTWEKIIVGQAKGDIKGLPATTIFALKNYFPEKFKENTALQGNGNTIVVFDSGVPVKTIETTAQTQSNPKQIENDIVEAEIIPNAVSDQVIPDFMVNADIPVKSLDSQQNEADSADILTVDDI